jgi:hypothetical protein
VQNVGDVSGALIFPQPAAAGVATISSGQAFPVRMRVNPSLLFYNPLAANNQIRDWSASADWSGTVAVTNSEAGMSVQGTTPAGSALGHASIVHWTADAEI